MVGAADILHPMAYDVLGTVAVSQGVTIVEVSLAGVFNNSDGGSGLEEGRIACLTLEY